MAGRKNVPVDYGGEVTRVYGVEPRPRSSVAPQAWARTKRPGKWRAYYGYRYNPDRGADMPSDKSPANKFSTAAIAAAMIAHQELNGRIEAYQPSSDEKRAAFMAEAVASVTHERKPERKRTAAEVFAASEAVILRKPEPVAAAPEPVREPGPVPAPEPAPAPFVAPAPSPAPAASVACTCSHERFALVAETLRELAQAYGPRRAHKLLAMADFVTAAAGIAA